MFLRLMDSAHGIVANFLLSLSVGACMVGDPPFQDLIHHLPGQETPLTIVPARAINDLPTELLARNLDPPGQETPFPIVPARTINDLPSELLARNLDPPGKETPLSIVPASTINQLPTELLALNLDPPGQETPLSIVPASTINDLPTELLVRNLDPPGQETPLGILPAHTINDLPTELLARILEYFQDDLSSLKKFSLISRPFLSICRKRLFSTLRLNSLGSSFNYQCDRWMSLLNHSTDFVASLRILELGPAVFRHHTHDKVYSDHWVQIVDQRVPSIHDSRVQTIIRHALIPQTLILRFEFQAWKNFSPTFQDTVIELIQRGTVSSLSLEDVVDFPMVALRECRYLRELSLISFHTESVEGPESGSFGYEALKESKGYLESLTLFASDQYVENLINVLSFPRSLLDLTKLRRLSVNLTGSDGRLAIKNIPLVARGITTLELRVGGQNADYNTCNLRNFPNLRSLLISISYNRHKRPIRDLATFLSKSDYSTPSKLEELKILFRHDVQELQHEKSPEDTMYMFQHKDWKIMERKLGPLNFSPTLGKLRLGLRPKDVGTFMNELLRLSCIFSLGQLMPTLCAVMDPTIEVFDDRFEQFTA